MRLASRVADLRTTVDRYPNLFDAPPGSVNLGPGDPQFPMPEFIAEGVQQALAAGRTRYTPVAGVLELRTELTATLRRDHGVTYGPDEIIVGAGSKQMLSSALLATVEPGDEVILVAPHYPVYVPMVSFTGAVPVVVPSDPAADYALPVDRIAGAITDKTRWIVLNSPNNPCGRTYTAQEYSALGAALAAAPRVGVLADQIYELLTFDGVIAPSIVAISPELRERSVLISGFSKAYSMTGLRVGYAAAEADLIRAMSRIHYVTTSCAASLSQYAALAALRGPRDAIVDNVRSLQRLCTLAADELAKVDGMEVRPPTAGLYVFANCAGLDGSRTPYGTVIESDLDLATYLDRAARVQVMPGTLFGLPGHLRITCAGDEDELREGLRRMVEAFAELRS